MTTATTTATGTPATGTPAEISDLDVEFASSPPGLGPLTSFRLTRIEGARGLYTLRSTGDEVRLFLVDPATVVSGYHPRITAGMRDEIGSDEDAVRVFVVANPSDEGVFVNLRAPVLLNERTGAAAQIIFEDTSYPLRAQLGAA
ncbi:flagellar assembly protein FliW [Microbacterium sp. KSW2-29]|uniref:Flagellar assembly protein FliW n=1 Tax=Microbacterium phycohabitans TaxID=3075993 RepID=A0ABU3SHP6_9MICO|nr:flagellar assembly protein FliW [Microbacterium sp. KSW2-29]MDU0344319.1 flagellar assembly protein FliW [Microbacterium sp. KSW2-29]